MWSDYERWSGFNKAMLGQLLQSQEIEAEYAKPHLLEPTYGVFLAEIEEFEGDVKEDIERLKLISDRLVLLDQIETHSPMIPENRTAGADPSWSKTGISNAFGWLLLLVGTAFLVLGFLKQTQLTADLTRLPADWRKPVGTVVLAAGIALLIFRGRNTSIESTPGTKHKASSQCRVLFFAANPSGTSRLSLDEEVREIEQKIRASEHRDSLSLITKWAVRPDDLLQHLNENRPQIVHFAGHGTETEEIILVDASGAAKPLGKAALKQLFTTMKDNIRIVVLNACFSRPQAEAITEAIDCAIGMKREIGDQAAIKVAAAFYRAVGFGRSVREAFDQGNTALALEGIPEEGRPELIVRRGVDPREIVLIPNEPSG